MEDNITKAEANEEQQTEQQETEQEKSLQEKVKEEQENLLKEILRSNEIIATGKGKLRLEKPIIAHDKEINELVYDFTEMTGAEYTEAMDGGTDSGNIYRITYRQSLNLFAKAAEKQTEDVDMHDIVEQIGMTDAVEAVQLATLFFNVSTRAGRRRISKK